MKLGKYRNYQTATQLITSLYQWALMYVHNFIWIIFITFSLTLAFQPLTLPLRSVSCRAHWRSDTSPPSKILWEIEIEGIFDWSCARCFRCETSPMLNRFHPKCRKEMACTRAKPRWMRVLAMIFDHLTIRSIISWPCWTEFVIMLPGSHHSYQPGSSGLLHRVIGHWKSYSDCL